MSVNLLEIDEEWSELISLDTPNLPRLNLSHLPLWAGDFARALSSDTETPPELAGSLVLVTCATAIARRLSVFVRPGYIEPCNLWTVVALPSGNRKSAVQAAATEPLLAWEREQSEIMEPEIKHYTSERKTIEAQAKEARNRAAKEKNPNKAKEHAQVAADLEEKIPEIPVQPQLWTSDATPERLGSLLVEHGECMAWLSSEGGIFELLQGRYSNGIPNLDLILKAHSGDSERVDRGSRPPVFLHNPRLCIGLSPQPDLLRGLASKTGFRGRGLLGRFLYLLPNSPLGFRSLESIPIPTHIHEGYEAGIRAMLNWQPKTKDDDKLHLLHLSNEAHEEWKGFSLEIEKRMRPGNELEHLTDWAGKAPGAAIRIAGVLHGIKHAKENPWDFPITPETMIDAIEMMRVFTKHSKAALDQMGADPTVAAARVIWNWMERNKVTYFSIREIFNELRGSFPRVQQLRSALDILEERGYVQIFEMPREGPGRPPSPIVEVRPELVKRWE